MSLSGDKGVAQFKKSVKMEHPISDLQSDSNLDSICNSCDVLLWDGTGRVPATGMVNEKKAKIADQVPHFHH